MKKLMLFLLVLVALSVGAYAQAPQGIPYQAIARNSSGTILASTAISVRFTIRDSVATGAIKYRETFSVTTSAQGMFSVNVGQGTPVTGTFSGINWGTNAKFMQVELDPAGGSSYVDMGTTQMMSVPYAMSSLSTSSIKMSVSMSGDTLFSGAGNYIIIPSISKINWIGKPFGGGVLAYIYTPDDPGYIAGQTHGLIASSSDLGEVVWGCHGTLLGVYDSLIGTGWSNTAAILSGCLTSSGIAAQICQTYSGGGYYDWHLPSLHELKKLYQNAQYIGTFSMYNSYFSSTEFNQNAAFTVRFHDSGNTGTQLKSLTAKVRAVRSF